MRPSCTLTAIFDRPAQARTAWNALVGAGYHPRQMSWMMSQDLYVHLEAEQGDRTPESAAKGLFAGAATGAITSVLTAFSVAAGGPLGALLAAGIGAGGGGLIGALVGTGYPHQTATQIVEAIPSGAVVIAVGADRSAELAEAERLLAKLDGRNCHIIDSEPAMAAQA